MTDPAAQAPSPGRGAPTSYYWFRQGSSRFAVRTADLVGLATFSVIRPIPLSDQSLVGFGLYQKQVVPVFDPVSLAGFSLDRIGSPVRVAVIAVDGHPTLAFLCTEAGSRIELSEADLAPSAGRLPLAFVGERPVEEDPLLVLDPVGLARHFGLTPGSPEPNAGASASGS